mmetsp:Transcript_62242/g.176790  ORF Transcript_62242/g.176790 Transcript_62242/m.176790 type:complete len:133 (-) Transcript_62242:447-845(-)
MAEASGLPVREPSVETMPAELWVADLHTGSAPDAMDDGRSAASPAAALTRELSVADPMLATLPAGLMVRGQILVSSVVDAACGAECWSMWAMSCIAWCAATDTGVAEVPTDLGLSWFSGAAAGSECSKGWAI